MKNKNVNMLYDGSYYWIHLWTRAYESINTMRGEVHFSQMKAVKAEMVHAFASGRNISADIIVVRNENNQYAIFSLYSDSSGEGGIYLSEKGFIYKSILGHIERRQDSHLNVLLIVEDIENHKVVLQLNTMHSYLYPFCALEPIFTFDETTSIDTIKTMISEKSLFCPINEYSFWGWDGEYTDMCKCFDTDDSSECIGFSPDELSGE